MFGLFGGRVLGCIKFFGKKKSGLNLEVIFFLLMRKGWLGFLEELKSITEVFLSLLCES